MIRLAALRFMLALAYLAYGLATTLSLGLWFPPSWPLRTAVLLARERHLHTPHPLRLVK